MLLLVLGLCTDVGDELGGHAFPVLAGQIVLGLPSNRVGMLGIGIMRVDHGSIALIKIEFPFMPVVNLRCCIVILPLCFRTLRLWLMKAAHHVKGSTVSHIWSKATLHSHITSSHFY